MAVSDDRCLDKWIRERDRESFLELVARHGGMVYGTALRITNNPDTALQVAVSCFEKLMKMDSLPQVPILIFLHREATRSALEVVKPLPLPTEPVNFPTWNDIKNRVDVLIANLTDKYSQALILHFLEGHAPANLVSYLRLPREKIEELIEKGVEHLRRGLSLLKINIGTSQLLQLLSANTYEPSPSALSDSILNLLNSFSTSESVQPTKQERKQSKYAVLVPIISVLIVVLMFLISVYFIYRGEISPSRLENEQVLQLSSVEQAGETNSNLSVISEERKEKKNDEEGQQQENTEGEDDVQLVLDLEKKLFELVYSRYEERKREISQVTYTSQDFLPTEPFYYYFIALESLPPIDPLWIQQLWESLFSAGSAGIPEGVRAQMATLSEVFSQWRSGSLLEKDNLPLPQIPGQTIVSVDAFQSLLELFSINILLNIAPQSEQSFQDIQLLHRFSVGIYKNAWGELVHIPLHGFECTSIVLRELARYRLLPQNMFRDTMRMLVEAEKAIQDKRVIRYNEYRQIASWAEAEFPNVLALRTSLKNFLGSPNEKEYIDKLSDSELQKLWDNFLRLPATDTDSSKIYPLEELRKMIFPMDFSIENHRTHTEANLLIGKLIVAIEWFGIENGVYPASIDSLVPNYISELKPELIQQIGIQYLVDFNTNLYQFQVPDETQILLPWRGEPLQ